MKNYEELKLEVVRFKSADVVTASGQPAPQPRPEPEVEPDPASGQTMA